MLQEYLSSLTAQEIVLDLGSGTGSLNWNTVSCQVIRLDLHLEPNTASLGVIADAADLPLLDQTVSAVIASHSLEHVSPLDCVVKEIGRVLKPTAFLYVAVPDASTVSDRLYRWLGRGGGHVNAFFDESDLRLLIESRTGLRCGACRLLFSSFAFLGPRVRGGRKQLKLILFGGASHPIVGAFAGCLRLVDTFLGTRLAVYGWEYIFCSPDALKAVLGTVGNWRNCWTNVCSSCGSAHSLEQLARDGRLRRMCRGLGVFSCPNCDSTNLSTSEIKNRCLNSKPM